MPNLKMENNIPKLIHLDIENRIFTIRNTQVMIDRDLAEIYGVETKRLNEQVRRNIERFPEIFRFQLTESEKNELVANCDRFKNLKHTTNNPYAFTEQGVAMLSAVLKSSIAVKVSIQIIQAFVEMRKVLLNNSGLLQRIEKVETKLIESDSNFERIFRALETKNNNPKENIFFNGQIYDAYSLIIQLIGQAKTDLLLIDNYIDNSVLDMFTKKRKGVNVTIITHPKTNLTTNDIEKFNKQYPFIVLKHSNKMHDRFLLIDKTKLYHIGASLKDLGKNCFALSLIEDQAIINHLLDNL